MTTREDVRVRLIELRIKKGYTQKQLAEELGLPNASTVGSWEIGKSEPSLPTFSKMCKIYGVNSVFEVFPELAEGVQSDLNVYSDEEKHLIDDYRELNDEGQTNLREHMELLRGALKYKKDNSSRRLASGA